MADQREYHNDRLEMLLTMLDAFQARVWTTIPAIVQSFDAAKMTAVVQPSIQGRTQNNQGVWSTVTLPVLVDCPVVFPSGGGFTLTFPVTEGDECVVHLSARCIDSWWQNGGVQPASDFRMHDLSDGFVVVGPRSQPRVLSSVSADTVQLRSDNGSAFVEIDAANNITLKTTATVVVDAPTAHFTGDVHVDGAVVATGDVTGAGTVLHTHVHGGVQAGTSDTGAPV